MRRFNVVLLLVVVAAACFVPVAVDVAWRGWHRFPTPRVWEVPGGDMERGRQAILAHGCGGCHTIPGIRTATGRVGPQLAGLRDQIYIAGVLPNMPENLTLWIRDPRGVNPLTAMPNLEVTEEEARDIAAYLYANP